MVHVSRGSLMLALMVLGQGLAGWNDVHAGEGCKLVAEFSVKAVKAGAFRGCRSGNPVACAVTAAAHLTGDRAENGLAKGCEWFVELVNSDRFRITIKSTNKRYVRVSYEELLRVQLGLKAKRDIERFKWTLKRELGLD